MMSRKEISISLDRDNRNNHNKNYKELYEGFEGVVKEVSETAFNKVIDASKLNWKEPVDRFINLPTESSEGDTIMTRDSGKVYRFNGSSWIEIQQIDVGPVNEIDTRLTQQLAETKQELEVKKMDKDTTDISVTQINKNKGKLDETYMSDDFMLKITGDAPIHSTPADRSITTEKIAKKAVSGTETNFINSGKNKFDKRKAHLGKALTQTGTLTSNVNSFTSDFIRVVEGEEWTNSTGYRIAFYQTDSEDSYTERLDTTSHLPRTFTIPDGASYMRVQSLNETVDGKTINDFQVEKNNKETYYEPFTDNVLSETSITVEKQLIGISNYTTTLNRVDGIVTSIIDTEEGKPVKETVLNRDVDGNLNSFTIKKDGKQSVHTLYKNSDGQITNIRRVVS